MSVPPDGMDARGSLLIFTTRRGRTAQVSLTGELDVTVAACLTDWAEHFTAGPARAVRLDLSGLGFADVAGTRALAQVCRLLQAWSRSFELSGVPAAVSRVTGLTGIRLPEPTSGTSDRTG
jgi:anti-anti-sigma factor